MIEPTLATWGLVISGLIIYLLLAYAQILMVTSPQGRKTKDILIGKGEEWRDKTHFRLSYGAAWADLIFAKPVLIAGSAGVLLGYAWGYISWAGVAAISVYINIIFWFVEHEYVYPKQGPLVYYTIYWGFFVYWGIAAVTYSIFRFL